MSAAPPVAAPHVRLRASVGRTMAQVMLALVPATLFGLGLFGWPAIYLFGVTILSAVAAEAACLGIAGRPVWPTLGDGSALLSGWLLALTLPPWAPWWIGAVGALLAIGVAKHAFGGIGQNPFNPAMVARVALLVSFPVEMTDFAAPRTLWDPSAPGAREALAITFGGAAEVDALSGATFLEQVRTALSEGAPRADALAPSASPASLLLGTTRGSLGETSAALILLGGGWLLYTRVITWHVPFSMLAALALATGIAHGIAPDRHPDALHQVLSGAALLGAFFIATDLVTSPVTAWGQLVYGAGCGVLVTVIRAASSYPEGVAFAVLLMNACTPLIDHTLRPRITGRDRRNRPLPQPDPVRERA